MWQTGKPIVMRITAKDWVEGGGDFVLLARILKDRGCDYLCLTSGGV
jgi:2,4-dienoyl-CoA reductase-like NADH-dependent reductase (Old Yellow Enzyme family)